MFRSLHDFYCSEAWRNFRTILLHEITTPNGEILSDVSGKPILKKYDIVLHHKIPLTPDNVNDYNISLNKDNIMIVTQREHNEIHARFGYTSQRKVYFVYGPPCGGKTTFVNSVKGNSDLVVDMDNVWKCITGGARYEKPNALKVNAFAVRDLLFDMVRTRTGKWERAYVIEGAPRSNDRQRRIDMLGAEEIFIDTDKDTCISRLALDPERTPAQKDEWKKYIETWFEEYTE